MPWASRFTCTAADRPGTFREPVVCGKEARTVSTLQYDPYPMPVTSRTTSPITTRRRRRDFFLAGIDVLHWQVDRVLRDTLGAASTGHSPRATALLREGKILGKAMNYRYA